MTEYVIIVKDSKGEILSVVRPTHDNDPLVASILAERISQRLPDEIVEHHTVSTFSELIEYLDQ